MRITPFFRIALVFLGVSIVWIIVSDLIVARLEPHLSEWGLFLVHSAKGIFYVTLLGIVVYRYLRRQFRKQEAVSRLYQELFDKNPHPMFLYDEVSLIFLEVNEAAVSRYGYSREEFLGMSLSDICPAEDRPAMLAAISQSPLAFHDLGIWTHLKKDGTVMLVHINENVMSFHGRPARVSTGYDVTEEMQSRSELESAHNFMDNVLRSIENGMLICDRQLSVVRINSQASRLLDIAEEDLLGRPVWEVFPQTGGFDPLATFSQLLATKMVFHTDLFVREQGCWLRWSAFPTDEGLLLFFHDVTTRKQAQLETLFSEQNLSALINNTSDIIWSLDLQYKLISFNEPFSRWQEYTAGRRPAKGDILPPMYMQAPWSDYYERARRGESFSVIEQLEVSSQAGAVAVQIGFNPIYADSGEVLGIGCFSRDISAVLEKERDLEKMRLHMEAILYNIQSGFCSIDRSGTVLTINKAFEDITGVRRNDLLGQPVRSEQYPLKGPFFERALEEVLNSGRRTKLESYDADREIWLEIFVFALPDGGASIYFNDITERKEAELQLRRSLEQYELISRAANDVIWDWAMDTDQLVWSRNVRDILGYDVTVTDYQWWLQLVHPDDRDEVEDIIQQTLAAGKTSWKAEYRFMRQDGSYVYILDRGFIGLDEDGKPARMLGSMQDIQQLKDSQATVQRLDFILSQSEESIVITDTEQHIEWVNRGFTKMTGYSLEEVRGHKPAEFLRGPETDPETERYIDEQLMNKQPFSVELINYRKNGEKYWLRMQVSPVFEQGRLRRFVSVQHDITTQVMQNERINDQNERLHEIAYLSAHQLRGPISSILGLTRVYELDDSDPQTNRRIIQYIRDTTDQLDSVIHRIIDKTIELEEVRK